MDAAKLMTTHTISKTFIEMYSPNLLFGSRARRCTSAGYSKCHQKDRSMDYPPPARLQESAPASKSWWRSTMWSKGVSRMSFFKYWKPILVLVISSNERSKEVSVFPLPVLLKDLNARSAWLRRCIHGSFESWEVQCTCVLSASDLRRLLKYPIIICSTRASDTFLGAIMQWCWWRLISMLAGSGDAWVDQWAQFENLLPVCELWDMWFHVCEF